MHPLRSIHPRALIIAAFIAVTCLASGPRAGASENVSAPDCDLHPIALSAAALAHASPGTILSNVFHGPQPGQFGWLTWSGSPSEPALVAALQSPNSASSYVNPDDPADKLLSPGDWVRAKPGVSNSKSVRDTLDALLHSDITLPVWNDTRGQGNHAAYRISAFARVRLLDYHLPGENRLTLQFLGYVTCGVVNQPPQPHAGSDQSVLLSDTVLLSGSVIDDGLPGNGISTHWSQLSGPAPASFESPTNPVTRVTFPLAGTYVLRLTADDSELTAHDDITITVNRPNQAPDAFPQSLATDEDTPLDLQLTGADPDDDQLTFTLVTPPAYGSLTGTPPLLQYTPIADFHGTDQFTFQVNDGELDSPEAVIHITIHPINDPPVADAQSVETDEDTPLAILLSGSDVDGDTLNFLITTPPEHGRLDGDLPALTYIPNPDFHGEDSFAFVADDGQLASDEAWISITVRSINDPPIVSAGPDQSIAEGELTLLNGHASDDDSPSPPALHFEWTQESGPGLALFTDRFAPVTTVQFDRPGTYILRLTADDGELSAHDELTITVTAANRPPTVTTVPNRLLMLGDAISLEGSVTDDGLPLHGTLTILWQQLSGPAPALISNPSDPASPIAFPEPGNYAFRLSAHDGELSAHADVTFAVRAPAMNQPPTVDAGPDLSIGLTDTLSLNATITDDGLPENVSITSLWSVISGPGTVTFADPTAPSTLATFSHTGTYILRLTADDSQFTAFDEVTISVYPFNLPPEVEAGPDQVLIVPDPEFLAPGGKQTTDPNIFLSRSLSSHAHWNTAIGQPGLSGKANGSSLIWVTRNGLAVDNGNVFAAGAFTNAGGILAKSLAQWDGSQWSAFYDPRPAPNPSTGDIIGFVTIDCDSAVFCNEIFDAVTARGPDVFAAGLLKDLDAADGLKDMSARWDGSGWEPWGFKRFGNHIRVLKSTPDLIYIGGHFAFQPTNASPDFFPDLPVSYNVATWDGTNWGTLGSGIVDILDSPSSSNPGVNNYHGYVTSMEIAPDGTVFVAGDFIMDTPTGRAHHVARWNGSEWKPLGTGLTVSSVGLHVSGIALAEDGNLYVGGTFTHAGDVPARNVARWDGQQWHALGTGPFNGVQRTVEAVAALGTDVYVAGQFTEAGGLSVRRIARWNGHFWSPLGLGVTNGTFGNIYALAADDSGLYVGGAFSSAGGLPAGNIAKWEFATPPPRGALLSGSVTDDGLPTNSTLSLEWTQVSGPGNTTFTDPHAAATDAFFSQAGTYVLRLTADDSDLSSFDELTIEVRGNRPPTVSAGDDQVLHRSDFAILRGSATDDANPETAPLSHVWTQIAGPAQVTFSNPGHLEPLVTFPENGTYVLRLTANDTQFSAHDDVTITVLAPNAPPVINLVSSTSPNSSGTSTLTASVSDDNRPNGVITYSWTRIDGPAAVYFSDPTARSTFATFHLPGTYTFRVTVSDGQYTAWRDRTVTYSQSNSAPAVHVDPPILLDGLTWFLPGQVTDDGRPSDAALTLSWSIITAPAPVTFTDPHAAATFVTLGAPGNYRFRLTATDSVWTRTRDVFVNHTNQPPFVTAGPPRAITLPQTQLTLEGHAFDDGLPSDTLALTWRAISGPGPVLWEAPYADNEFPATLGATFSDPGEYLLELIANDSALSTTGTVTIVVAPEGNEPPHVDAGPDQTIPWPQTSLTLSALVTDDSLPHNSTTLEWSLVHGPAAVHFSDPHNATSIFTFPAPGQYILRLTATDGELTNGDDVLITITSDTNQPPSVDAGPDFIARVLTPTPLAGTIHDDGLPAGFEPLILWTKLSGPGKVTFSDPISPLSTAHFGTVGTYILRLTGTDLESTAFDDVTVEVTELHHPPVVNAGPGLATTTIDPLTLFGSATDDGLPIGAILTPQWTLIDGPGLVRFTDPANYITSASFYFPGTYTLRLTVNDTQLSGFDELTVTVTEPVNEPPFVHAGADLTVTRPHAAELDAHVFDDGLPIGHPLFLHWTKVEGPGDVAFTWQQGPDNPDAFAIFTASGTYVLRLTADDSELSNSDTVTVTVLPGTNAPPIVNAGPDLAVSLPHPAIFTHATATDDGLPHGTLLKSWSTIIGPGPVHFSTINNVWRATFTEPGSYTLRFTATDSELTSTDDVLVTVHAETPPPFVELLAPLEATVIKAPTDILGTVDSPILSNWELQRRPAPPTHPSHPSHPSHSAPSAGPFPWTPFASGSTSLHETVLGSFDPTLLLNGLHQVRLVATDVVGRTSVTEPVTLSVEGVMKFGHFAISFNDLTLPVAGIPIQITRAYDSRDTAPGDFGAGWSLELRNIRLRKNHHLGRDWEHSSTGGNLPVYCIDSANPRLITVTFPDGRVHRFQALPNPECQALAPLIYPRIAFHPFPGTYSTLRPVLEQHGDLIPDDQLVWGASSPFSPDPHTPPAPVPGDFISWELLLDPPAGPAENILYNPDLFELTTPEGYTYLISETNGLRRLTDPNGNSLSITRDGLFHSTGLEVLFQRDHLDRITNITDTAGLSLAYEYDDAGNLTTFTDREGNAHHFTYDDQHHLLALTDARGITPLTNEYAPDGRLLGHTDALGRSIAYNHDPAQHVTSVTDRTGAITTHVYDADGNLTRSIDPLGGITDITHDDEGRRTSITDPLDHVTRFTYNPTNGALASVINALGETNTFITDANGRVLAGTERDGTLIRTDYDPFNNLTNAVDALGHAKGYTYNSLGKPTHSLDALGHSSAAHYDSFGNLLRTTNALGHTAEFIHDANLNLVDQIVTRTVNGVTEHLTNSWIYDAQDRVINAIAPDGSSRQTRYNELGHQSAVIDELGRETAFSYDLFGRLVTTTFPDGTSEGHAYDAENRRIAHTNRLGQITRFVHDPLGRLISTVLPDGSASTNHFDAAGRLIAATDPRGHSTWFGHDALGRVTAVTNAILEVTRYAYDARGNRLTVTDPLGHTTTNVFDAANRLIAILHPDGTSQEFTHDALGRRLSETDQSGNTTRFGYDPLGRLIAVTNALHQVTRYEYNELGEQTAQIDAEGRVTRYLYDNRGRRISRILPLGQTDLATYDHAGNLIAYRDFNGRTTTYEYDALNRLTRKKPDAALHEPPVTYAYNALGLRDSMTDATGVSTYLYDALNRLHQKITPFGTLTYSYDANNNVTRIQSSNPNGADVTYEYDALNRLAAVNDSRLGRTPYSYDPAGNLRSFTQPNGITTFHEYDSLHRLTNVTASTLLHTVNSWRYTLAPTGHRASVTELDQRTVTYNYDPLHRITLESIIGAPINQNGTVTYTYDAVGNRLARNSTLPGILASGYAYDANDRLTTDQYDPNGNTLIATLRANTIGAPTPIDDQYDFENRLTQRLTVLDGQPVIIDLLYDGDGLRVGKTVRPADGSSPGITTFYLVDALNPTGYPQVLEELTFAPDDPRFANPVVTCVYTWGHALLSQDRFDFDSDSDFDADFDFDFDNGGGTSTVTGTWTAAFPGYDGQGSVRYLADLHGFITDAWDYDAFGNILRRTGDTPCHYLYQGEQFDPDLGLYYLRARYADPDRGRFWTMDSFEGFGTDPLSLHKYTFNHNDPVNRRDPSGHISLTSQSMANTLAPMVRFALQQLQRSFTTCNLTTASLAGSLGSTLGGAISGGVTALIQAFTGEFNLSEINDAIGEGMKDGFLEGFALGLNPYVFMAYTGYMSFQAGLDFWKTLNDPTAPAWMKYVQAAGFVATVLPAVSPKLARKLNDLLAKYCFPEGTPIATADGQKPIEQIRPGDLVWAADERTGDIMLQRVKRTFINAATALVLLTAGTNTVEATPEHPFWIADQGWKPAAQIQPGDHLLTRDGTRLPILTTQTQHLDTPIPVHNFEVEHLHTYFAGPLEALVHNACEQPPQTSSMSVTVEANHAAFWSGRQGANRKTAEASGFTTLEQTPAGMALEAEDLFSKLPHEEALKSWNELSERFAGEVQGTVNAWVGGSSPSSVWNRIELPRLLQNPAVTKIVIHDATQPWKQKIIYKP